jgi:hypothetical protein
MIGNVAMLLIQCLYMFIPLGVQRFQTVSYHRGTTARLCAHRHASTRWDATGPDALYSIITQPYSMRGQQSRVATPTAGIYTALRSAHTHSEVLKNTWLADRPRAQTPCRGTPSPRCAPPVGTGRAAGRNMACTAGPRPTGRHPPGHKRCGPDAVEDNALNPSVPKMYAPSTAPAMVESTGPMKK